MYRYIFSFGAWEIGQLIYSCQTERFNLLLVIKIVSALFLFIYLYLCTVTDTNTSLLASTPKNVCNQINLFSGKKVFIISLYIFSLFSGDS